VPEVVRPAARGVPDERRERQQDDQAQVGGGEALSEDSPRAASDPGAGNRDDGRAQLVSFWIFVTMPLEGSKNCLSTLGQPPSALIVKSHGRTGNLKCFSTDGTTGL
jgi:hypothetical protein